MLPRQSLQSTPSFFATNHSRSPMPDLLPSSERSKHPIVREPDVRIPKKARKQRKTYACTGELSCELGLLVSVRTGLMVQNVDG